MRTEDAGVTRLVGLYGMEERTTLSALDEGCCEGGRFGENWNWGFWGRDGG